MVLCHLYKSWRCYWFHRWSFTTCTNLDAVVGSIDGHAACANPCDVIDSIDGLCHMYKSWRNYWFHRWSFATCTSPGEIIGSLDGPLPPVPILVLLLVPSMVLCHLSTMASSINGLLATLPIMVLWLVPFSVLWLLYQFWFYGWCHLLFFGTCTYPGDSVGSIDGHLPSVSILMLWLATSINLCYFC